MVILHGVNSSSEKKEGRVQSSMSVNQAFANPKLDRPSPTPESTHGIVGPQSAADPGARLRRLLMMGAEERKRVLQRSTPTGASPPAKCSLSASDPSVKAS